MNKKGIGLFGLIGIVVGSCIGTGAFAMSGQIAQVASPGAAIIAFIIVGVGFAFLALSFSNLGAKQPELTGVFSYATEGFGPFAGFISGWGYWLSAWLGNVAYATMLCSTIGYFYKPFLPGNTLPCILFASLVMWAITFLVIKGVESATFLNTIVTAAKVIGLVLFVCFAFFSFEAGIFTADFWGNVHDNAVAYGVAGANAVALGDISQQVSACFIILMWSFIGIEGATVLSSRASNKKHVGKATIIGLLVLVLVYMLVTLLTYGVMPFDEVSTLPSPATVYVFEKLAPGWGGAFISIAIIFSIFGAWLSFTILPTQTASEMAEEKLLPARWGKLNKHNSPQYSLIITAICTQIMVTTLIVSDNAYNTASAMCTISIVCTWAFAAAYQAKYSFKQKEYVQLLFGVLAFVFLIAGSIMKGWGFILLSCVGYVPGFFFYYRARKENGKKLSKPELAIMAVVSLLAVVAIVCLFMGIIKV